MLGCRVEYRQDAAPQVIPAGMDRVDVDPDRIFNSDGFLRLVKLQQQLKSKYGFLAGDINWSGVLNIALDLVGQNIFTDMLLDPDAIRTQFSLIAQVIERFTDGIGKLTGTTSVSVNRNVRHMEQPVFLHSECSHTMISTNLYEDFLLPVDLAWSQSHRPFGIHYCGKDPHRYAQSFATIPNLDFLDLGWGGDVALLRKHLPNTFLNIRLDPVAINNYSEDELAGAIASKLEDSGNPWLTGVCCINMDDAVQDDKVEVIFRTVEEVRRQALH
jgi:hypothetical protein